MSDVQEQIESRPKLSKNCHNCANSHFNSGLLLRTMTCGIPCGLSCASCADSPGVLQDVTWRSPCANFREKRPPQIPRVPKELPDDSIRFVPLSKGLYATVDAADYDRVNQYRWCASSCGHKIYAVRNVKHRTVFMHRFIMKPPRGKFIDHIDGNGLNNRRANLRFCNQQQNNFNRHGGGRFRGVQKYPRSEKYRGVVHKNGKAYCTRVFDNPIDAARARDQLAIKHHGPFAYLNNPDEAQTNGEGKADDRGHAQPVQPTPGPCITRMPIYPSPKPKTRASHDAKHRTHKSSRVPTHVRYSPTFDSTATDICQGEARSRSTDRIGHRMTP
jgi:hypothetical protein